MLLLEDLRDLADMLAFLGRAVPPAEWVDECRRGVDRSRLEELL